MNQAKCEHKTEIERFTKAISDKNIQLHLIVAIQALDKANEQFTEQVALALKDAIIANEQVIYAHKLVEFLYTTKKRQHLANWMKRRLPFKVHGTAVAWEEDENDFKSLLDDIDGAFNDTEVFRMFVNQCFPCWTGTLTCFMLSGNSVANKALSEGKIVEKCTESLNSHESAYKVIGILFTLELVDSWNDVKSITGSTEGTPTRTAQYDPYDCVPVPNTAYIRLQTPSKAYYQGSCMISTIRNLMYILCRATSDSTEIVKENMKEDIKTAFSDLIHTVPGTTSASTLKGFAEKILPSATDQYQPTLELFVCV